MENLSVDMSKSAMAQGSIASRFESQSTVDEAKEQREKEWKEAYARIGQEAPKMEEEVHDGRTLYERLQTAQAIKDEEWETRLKLGNQFRGLHEEEFEFLSSEEKKKRDREAKWRAEENKEINAYREQLAAKHAAMDAAIPIISPSASVNTASSSAAMKPKVPLKPGKKDMKSLMKGIVVKKKPKAAAPSNTVVTHPALTKSGEKPVKRPAEGDDEDGGKKQKV